MTGGESMFEVWFGYKLLTGGEDGGKQGVDLLGVLLVLLQVLLLVLLETLSSFWLFSLHTGICSVCAKPLTCNIREMNFNFKLTSLEHAKDRIKDFWIRLLLLPLYLF